MHQPTFASVEFEQKTRREVFLERLDALVPWEELEARIEPHYPKPGRGRRPYPLAVMLRIHVVQLSYNLSAPAMEDLLYEAESARRFCGLYPERADPRREHDPALSPPAGASRTGDGAVRGDQRPPRAPWAAPARGHDRGRHDHRGAVVDEKPPARARPGDAPDEEREPLAFRHEAAHRRRFRDGAGAQPAHDSGERGGRDGGAPLAARWRAGSVRGRGLPGRGEAPGAVGRSGCVAGGDAARPEAAAGQREPEPTSRCYMCATA